MFTIDQLKKSLERGTRVLLSKAFADLHPAFQNRQVVVVQNQPLHLAEVNRVSQLGWGQAQDLLFVVLQDLPVVGYVGRIVGFGVSEKMLKLGWVDEVYPSVDADLWMEALDLGGPKKLNWSDLAPLRNEEVFDGSFERPILFLDRDNVIVHDVPYNKDPDQVQLLKGSVDVIRRAHDLGWWVAMVSNQSGLGRGKIRFDEYGLVHRRMQQLLAEQGQWLDESEWAAFIADGASTEGRGMPALRKPRPGMFWEVQRKLKGSLIRSVMVGDSATDLLAAHQVGIEKLYLLKSNHWEKQVEQLQASMPELRYHVIEELEQVEF